MELKDSSLRDPISPIPAQSIADLELDEKVYKPDFEITAKYQAFSKELSRIALLGLGVYGFLIKMATDQPSIRERQSAILVPSETDQNRVRAVPRN
jgi:hypothetical protein